jgi:hypothetical protein
MLIIDRFQVIASSRSDECSGCPSDQQRARPSKRKSRLTTSALMLRTSCSSAPSASTDSIRDRAVGSPRRRNDAPLGVHGGFVAAYRRKQNPPRGEAGSRRLSMWPGRRVPCRERPRGPAVFQAVPPVLSMGRAALPQRAAWGRRRRPGLEARGVFKYLTDAEPDLLRCHREAALDLDDIAAAGVLEREVK